MGRSFVEGFKTAAESLECMGKCLSATGFAPFFNLVLLYTEMNTDFKSVAQHELLYWYANALLALPFNAERSTRKLQSSL